MFPPTRVFNPLLARISPTSVVVVVLPFEPVMATIALQERSELNFADHWLPSDAPAERL